MNKTDDPAGYSLPRYKCHKEVGALKIAAIEIKKNGTAVISPADEGYPVFEAPAFKHKFKGDENDPGYYVVYADGYDSWSPTRAFEEGYTRIQAPPTQPGNAQRAATAQSGKEPEVNAVPDKPADEKPKKTLAEACDEFLGRIDYVLYTRGKRLGDLLALRRDIENFQKIGHPILKEPVE